MDHRLIAVGSKRGPKLDAVHDALKQCAHLLGSDLQFEVVGFAVESGVSHTPLSSRDSMLGARQRAEALIRMATEKQTSFQYYVGLEGGLEVIESNDAARESTREQDRLVLLESWAYVSDGSRGHFGRSGAVELPPALAHEVLKNGVELATAIDQFAGLARIRDSQGAWGVLSCDLITRREAFRIALIAAFAPFYNSKLFRSDGAAVEFR
jgi:inosine/xanthosine triphosphatase